MAQDNLEHGTAIEHLVIALEYLAQRRDPGLHVDGNKDRSTPPICTATPHDAKKGDGSMNAYENYMSCRLWLSAVTSLALEVSSAGPNPTDRA